MKINKTLTALIAGASFGLSGQVFAEGTAAGTTITNTVTLGYTVSTVPQTDLTLDVDFLVDTKVDFNLSNDETLQKVLTVNLGRESEVEIIKSTENGNLSTLNSGLNYQPNENFFGRDEFTLKVKDNYISSIQQVIELVVINVNDAPSVTLSMNTDYIVSPKSQVILSAQITDIDSQDLVISWQQISGPTVDFSIENDKHTLLFIAPNPSPFTSVPMRFELKVDDGIQQTSTQVNLSVETKSAGSIVYLILFLIASSLIRIMRTYCSSYLRGVIIAKGI